jgi:hypothetical protein
MPQKPAKSIATLVGVDRFFNQAKPLPRNSYYLAALRQLPHFHAIMVPGCVKFKSVSTQTMSGASRKCEKWGKLINSS